MFRKSLQNYAKNYAKIMQKNAKLNPRLLRISNSESGYYAKIQHKYSNCALMMIRKLSQGVYAIKSIDYSEYRDGAASVCSYSGGHSHFDGGLNGSRKGRLVGTRQRKQHY